MNTIGTASPDAKMVLTEGDNDIHVAGHIMQKRGMSLSEIGRKSAGSKEKLLSLIPVLLKQSGLSRLVIIVDADLDCVRCYRSICAKVKLVGVDLPDVLPADGLVHRLENGLVIGIWIMPNCVSAGSLEDFLVTLAPATDLWGFAGTSTIESRRHGAAFADSKLKKARLHAYLAWCREPGSPYGRAVAQGFLGFESPVADTFCRWLKAALDL